MNDIVNDKKDHNIVNHSLAHKPDGHIVKLTGQRCQKEIYE